MDQKFNKRKAAGGVPTAKQVPHRPGIISTHGLRVKDGVSPL